MADKEIGKVQVSKNDDGKAVWEFEGLVTSDVKLKTDSQDFANAINELAKKLEQEGGGDDEPTEDWQPPANWIPVPDPAAYEVYILIDVTELTYTNKIDLSNAFEDPNNGWAGYGTMSIDWGDGSVGTYGGYDYDSDGGTTGTSEWTSGSGVLEHEYSSKGQYLIKAILSPMSCWFRAAGSKYHIQYPQILICKTGSAILLANNFQNAEQQSSYHNFGGKMQYFKHLGISKFPARMFADCYSLVKVDFAQPLTIISSYMFNNCINLRQVDVSEVTEIKQSAFEMYRYCFAMPSMKFPKCKIVGNSAFSYCAGLKKIDLPICERIESGAFQYTYSLTEVNVPNCISIGAGAFTWSALKKIDLPTCETIGDRCFNQCYGLKEITVPESCKFGANCFYNCWSLYNRPDGTSN